MASPSPFTTPPHRLSTFETCPPAIKRRKVIVQCFFVRIASRAYNNMIDNLQIVKTWPAQRYLDNMEVLEASLDDILSMVPQDHSCDKIQEITAALQSAKINLWKIRRRKDSAYPFTELERVLP